MSHKSFQPHQMINSSSSVIFDSRCSLLQGCLRQSISLWSVVVNSAGFGLKTYKLELFAKPKELNRSK
ncbi:hypothetical protein EBU02_00245 [bacterium]|nr:hypothetical protein [bacterium]NBS51108.1 hypothetical protein [Spartobacteria bacterium]